MTSFQCFGPESPGSPVVLSAPHAGRDYPLELRAALSAPPSVLTMLEDRHVDALALAARTRETLLIQRRARAWIDLNRAEHERDPRIDDGAEASLRPLVSAKVRSGLGLVPRRTSLGGHPWRRRFTGEEIARRIAEDHRPYHAALARALAAAKARFGVAVLVDLHSMPPLTGDAPARVVLGDRFGRAAGGRFLDRLEAELAAAGMPHAMNAPYAGGHILERHGRPAEGIHALQIEIDRTLYLDARLDAPGAGLPAAAALLRRLLDALEDEAVATAHSIAAE